MLLETNNRRDVLSGLSSLCDRLDEELLHGALAFQLWQELPYARSDGYVRYALPSPTLVAC